MLESTINKSNLLCEGNYFSVPKGWQNYPADSALPEKNDCHANIFTKNREKKHCSLTVSVASVLMFKCSMKTQSKHSHRLTSWLTLKVIWIKVHSSATLYLNSQLQSGLRYPKRKRVSSVRKLIILNRGGLIKKSLTRIHTSDQKVISLAHSATGLQPMNRSVQHFHE